MFLQTIYHFMKFYFYYFDSVDVVVLFI